MQFDLLFTDQACSNYEELKKSRSLLKRFKAVRKALGYLEVNPRHQSLNTHKYDSMSGPKYLKHTLKTSPPQPTVSSGVTVPIKMK